MPEDPHVTAIKAAQGAQAAGAPDNLPPGIQEWLDENPDVPIQYPAELPMLTQTGDEAWAVLLAAVDGPDPLTHQCRGVKGWAQVKGEYAEFYLDPDPELIDEIGRRMIFPNPRADGPDQRPVAADRERHLRLLLPAMSPALLDRIDDRDANVVVVGQGYVGLPVAMRAVEVGFRVVGYELDADAPRGAARPAARTSRTSPTSGSPRRSHAGYVADRPGRGPRAASTSR